MPEYVAPTRDMEFVLFDLLDAESTWRRIPALAEVTRDLVTAVLEEGGKIASEQLAPLNQVGDRAGLYVERRRRNDAAGIQAGLSRARRTAAGSVSRAIRTTAARVCRRC